MKKHHKQSGIALLVFVFFIALFVTIYAVRQLNVSNIKIEREKRTARALAEAKAALIGWSVTRGAIAGSARPGELPCPDTDVPSSVNYGVAQPSCVVGQLGRLPWKTLGTEELRDGYGEPLWYSVDGAFRIRFGSAPSTNQPINSDTKAQILVYASDGITSITPAGSEAAAVIFSAGFPVAGQARSATISALCSATGTNILQYRCASNYLESTNGRNNAINNGPYIVGDKTSTFNDQLLLVTASELMTTIEKRVAKEALALLEDYKNVNGYYPYPAKFDSTGCNDIGNTGTLTDCQSDTSICRGRFPDNASTAAPTPNWTLTNLLPSWFKYNLWGQVIYYSAGDSSLASSAGCAPQLSLDTANVNGLLIMPNTPTGNIVRNYLTQSNLLTDYFDDAENQDGWGAVANDVYVTPSSASKDKIYVLP